MLVNPFYFARRGLRQSIAGMAPHIRGRTLDVGCGQKPYAGLFNVTQYIGLELDTPENRRDKRADCFYDGANFPFEAASFDSILAFEVFEHVFNPDTFLSEVHRVLAPGGLLLLTVPFAWDEHEQPHDFARYSSFGLTHLLSTHGFELVEHRKSVADLRAVLQLLNCYWYKLTAGRSAVLNLLWTMLLMAPVNVLGQILGPLLPANPDLYLDNVVLARKRITA